MRLKVVSLSVTTLLCFHTSRNASAAPPTVAQVKAVAGEEAAAVLNVAPMSLPETGVEAYAVKLLTTRGESKVLAVAKDGTRLAHDQLVAAEEMARSRRYGRLLPRLFNQIRDGAQSSVVLLDIWAKVELQYPSKDRLLKDPSALAAHLSDNQARLARAVEPIVSWLHEHSAMAVNIASLDDIVSPMVKAAVSSEVVPALAQLDAVAWIDLDMAGKPASTVWYTNTAVASARTLTTGSGVASCIVQRDQPLDYTYLNVVATASSAGCSDYHSQAVGGIISNTYSGNATSVTGGSIRVGNWDQFSFNSTYPTMWSWCNAQGTQIMNFSWTTESGTDPNFGSIDYQIDWYAKNYPYPLIITAAGNESGYCQNKNRNGLVVGASDDKGTVNTGDDTIASLSSWQNPATLHNDLELPGLVAPGVGVDSANLSNYTGTSLSTAQVTGAAMLLVSRDSSLTGWPEEMRAVLMATATANVDGSPFAYLPAGDLKDGVGRLSTYNAVLLAGAANSVGVNNVARANGRSHVTMSLVNDFVGGVYNGVWNIQPAVNGNVRVVGAWDATAACSGQGGTVCTETLDADLDLLVYNSAGALVCSSTSFDASWEGCDFSAAAGSTYTVKVSQASRSQSDTYFALA
jgi:hypothetical protein